MWVRVIKSLFGEDGGLSCLIGFVGAWGGVVRVGKRLETNRYSIIGLFHKNKLEVVRTLPFGKISEGNFRLCEKFLHFLAWKKGVLVSNRFSRVDGSWQGMWDWSREP